MEETELEEGEALCFRGADEDSTIDPDITLSYIGEKLQDVLGHFQKDFEGGVSAENLGAKFGGYGSFLPTYQRSPSWSRTKSPSDIQNYNRPRSPRKLHSEDQRHNSLASSSASPTARLRDASGTTVSTNNYLKDDVHLPFRNVDEFSLNCGVVKKSVNTSDQRTLKVRIKVGSENLSTQKNAEIYSGLGLVVSPSSSLDDSPATGERLSGSPLDVPEESPTSILQIMTSFSVGLLLSPLSEDLVYLTEKIKLIGNCESKLMDKTNIESSGMLVNGSLSSRSNQRVLEQKKWKSSEKDSLFLEVTNQKNSSDQNDSVPDIKEERETDFDTLGCDELVSNALKLPLLSNSQFNIADTSKGIPTASMLPLNVLKAEVKGETFSGVREKKILDSESAQNIVKVERLAEMVGSSGKVSESKKGNIVSSFAACPQYDVLKTEKSHASDQSESNVSKKRKAPSAEPFDPLKQLVIQKGESGSEECLKSALEKSSSGGKKKLKGVQHVGALGSNISKDQLAVDSSTMPKSGKSSHANSLVSKNDSHDLQNNHEKPGDRHNKDVFGDLGLEDDNESVSGEMSSSGRLKGPQLHTKRNMNEYHNGSKEKCNKKSTEKPHSSEKYPRVASHMAPPSGNGPSSEAPTGNAPVLKEDWVCCDKCHKWRLLPLGTNPTSLPDKWLCRMLTWLPGKNRCSIPEEETTSALRALYHPATLVPNPTSESQHNQLNSSIGTSVGVPSVDAGCPGLENQNSAVLAATISEKKKHGSNHTENSTDIDGSTHSSNSRKNLPTSGKTSNSNKGNHPPLDACGYQHMRQSSSAEKRNDNQKDKKESLVNCSDTGTIIKIMSKQEPVLAGSRASKTIKEDATYDDEKWTSDKGRASFKAGRCSTNGLSNNASRSDRNKFTNHKDSKGDAKKNIVSGVIPEKIHVPDTSDDGLLHPDKLDSKDIIRKRKGKEHHCSQIHTKTLSSSGRRHPNSGDFADDMCESDHRKEKKARVSKSGGKDTSASKSRLGTDGKGKSTDDQHNGQYLNKNQAEDNLKTDRSLVQSSVAANSSSSKLSSSRNNKSSAQEVKGSPVESVSSSPLRFYNADKVTSTRKNRSQKDDFQDSYSLTAASPRRFSGGEDDGGTDGTGMVKKDEIFTCNDRGPDVYSDPLDHDHNSVSHSKKLGKELSSNSKYKTHTSGSDSRKDKIKTSDSSHDYLDHGHYDEKSKSRRNKFDEKSATPGMVEKFICKKDNTGGTLGESSKGRSQMKFEGHDGQDVVKSRDRRHSLHQEHDDKKLHKKSDQGEVNGNGKSHSLPPLARVQTETVDNLQFVPGPEKENGVKVMTVDAFGNGDALKAPNQNKKADNQNGQPISLRHPTPNSHKARDAEAPSPIRRDSSSHAANNALKEAKDLKHAADRLKNSGSTDSNGFYFQAALKFLHGASLLESGSIEGSKNNELMHSMHIYSSTAKLCEFCAHEFEKSEDMAAAALAYKCMEVAYMRVIYSSHSSANRDRNELQNALHIVPPGESPSSSASDVDNLNQATTDKAAALSKAVGSPQVSGSHIITSRNRSGFMRLLNFAQDVYFAMEASRKSRNAFSAATSKFGEITPPKEGICSLKKALDFNFQDVEGLLRLVRVSMETINR